MSDICKYLPSLLVTLLFVCLRSTAHGAAKEKAIEEFKATSLWPME